ncbi:MAG: pirin [bacterium]|nr:pirin [bacterium]
MERLSEVWGRPRARINSPGNTTEIRSTASSSTHSSRSARRLAAQALAIEAKEAREAGALGFMARMLVQATLPHRRLERMSFDRRNGRLRLSIYAHPDVGLPYGRYPRLLLIWVCSEAVKTRSPLLELGPTLSSFMYQLGLIPSGGNWGTIHRLRDQMRRLFASTIAYTYDDSAEGHWRDRGFRIAEDVKLWWNVRDLGQVATWRSTVELNRTFYDSIVGHPVPIDLRAIRVLRSPMALDIYCWLTHRNSYLRRKTLVPWDSLQLQFGARYSRTRAFRAAFLRHASKVLALYPDARIESREDGLLMRPAPSHVRR